MKNEQIFDRKLFEDACATTVRNFEKTAPLVSNWADWLYQAKDKEITLADLHLLNQVNEMQPNYACNRLLHLFNDLGRDTTGMLGF